MTVSPEVSRTYSGTFVQSYTAEHAAIRLTSRTRSFVAETSIEGPSNTIIKRFRGKSTNSRFLDSNEESVMIEILCQLCDGMIVARTPEESTQIDRRKVAEANRV